LVGMILLGRLRPIRVLFIGTFLDEHHLLGSQRLVISMMMGRLQNVKCALSPNGKCKIWLSYLVEEISCLFD
jgi:hypothetical protein